MSFDVTSPQVIDLTPTGLAGGEARCDLCRTEALLFRLIETTDALCASCFGMWHG